MATKALISKQNRLHDSTLFAFSNQWDQKAMKNNLSSGFLPLRHRAIGAES
jgi:hypothetical protein